MLHDDLLGRALDRVHLGEIDFAVTPYADSDDRFDCEPLSVEEIALYHALGNLPEPPSTHTFF